MDTQQQTHAQQLDPTVVNMARAIKATETAGQSDPYTAVGKSGEYGAYQYTPDTWATDSQKYLGQAVPLQGATIEQQNKVAYGKIADLKNQGNNPAQVASIWNSGKPDPTGNVGTNAKGVKYDTPQYVNSVVSAYNQFKSGNTNPTTQSTSSTVGSQNNQQSQAPQDQSLSKELQGRLSDAGTALTNASTGKINWLSGLIQSLGAAGGAVGDVVNKGLELIPGIKQGEGLLSQATTKLANTNVGKSVISAVQSFQQAHPELSDDIEAGFNIATALPIFSGLSAVKDVAFSTIGKALENGAEKGATDSIGEVLANRAGVAGKKVAQDTDTIMNGIVKPRNLPSIADGKYVTDDAWEKAGDQVSDIEQNELQPLLKKSTTQIPVQTLREQALATAKDELSGTGNLDSANIRINKIFDENQAKYGDTVNLKQANDMKRTVRGGVNFQSPQVDHDVNYIVGQTLQKSVEDGATTEGLGDVNSVNKKMSTLLKAQKMLKLIEGKRVKTGVLGKLIHAGLTGAATAGGEALGGVPGAVAGGLAGNAVGKLTEKGLGGGLLRNMILNRTGQATVAPTVSSILGKTGGLVGSALLQKQVGSR